MEYQICSYCKAQFSYGDKGVGPNACGTCINIITERSFFFPKEFKIKLKDFIHNKNAESIKDFILENKIGDYEQIKFFWEFCEEEGCNLIEILKKLDYNHTLNKIKTEFNYFNLVEVLNTYTGESGIGNFLYNNQILLHKAIGSINHHGESSISVKEFQFGADFRADFLNVKLRRSLPPEIYLIELEPINEIVFTKKGLPSHRLLGAINQLKQWKNWILDNSKYFIELLRKNTNNSFDTAIIFQWLKHKEISIKGFVFIGRRNDFKDNDFRYLWNEKDITIHSYDTLLDICRYDDYDNISANCDIEVREIIRELRKENYNPKRGLDDIFNPNE